MNVCHSECVVYQFIILMTTPRGRKPWIFPDRKAAIDMNLTPFRLITQSFDLIYRFITNLLYLFKSGNASCELCHVFI
jgi:hypothetical protein